MTMPSEGEASGELGAEVVKPRPVEVAIPAVQLLALVHGETHFGAISHLVTADRIERGYDFFVGCAENGDVYVRVSLGGRDEGRLVLEPGSPGYDKAVTLLLPPDGKSMVVQAQAVLAESKARGLVPAVGGETSEATLHELERMLAQTKEMLAANEVTLARNNPNLEQK